MMTARERLWLTRDPKRLVPEGHKDAATLYAAPGDEIPTDAAKQFGLEDGMIKGSPAHKARLADAKQAAAPADKESKSPPNKESTGAGSKQAKAGAGDGKSGDGK